MNLLDENFPDDQREQLRKFGVVVRQIGHDEGHFGITDAEIIPCSTVWAGSHSSPTTATSPGQTRTIPAIVSSGWP